MRNYRFRPPPRVLRSPGVHFDNLALLPGNLLPFKAKYQEIANRLPTGTVLIILPTSDSPHRNALVTAANLLKAKGYPVASITSEHFSK